MSRLAPVAIVISVLALAGCNQKARERLAGSLSGGGQSAAAKGNHEEFMQIDEETTQEEIGYMQAAKDFYLAIAAREYEKAYGMLSTYATTNVTPYQFVGPSDPAGAKPKEPPRIAKLTKDDFVAKMKEIEQHYGAPTKVNTLWVAEHDPAVLAGKGDRLSAMFAIGMMPESTPVDARKAAIRGQIGYRLKPEDLKKLAEENNQTVEEIEKDDDFNPYFSIKTVLLDEGGKLQIGYFEFVPPSMFD